ncbi:MAG: hypothetical protein LBL09_05050 [Oscillospiraceae bacterium]|jgi:hypothetical protein|nr:hypothetical protein [Oscillospiraceae bacterium]
MKAFRLIASILLGMAAIAGILVLVYCYMDSLLKPFYSLKNKYVERKNDCCDGDMCMCGDAD